MTAMTKPARLATLALLAGFASSLPSIAMASSDEAWAAFRADVEAKCTAAGDKYLKKAKIAVDPVGSERLGLAVLWGKSKSTGDKVTMICAYDKRTKAVELGSEMGNDQIRVRKGKDGTDSGEEE